MNKEKLFPALNCIIMVLLKQLLDEVFMISGIIKVEVGVIS